MRSITVHALDLLDGLCGKKISWWGIGFPTGFCAVLCYFHTPSLPGSAIPWAALSPQQWSPEPPRNLHAARVAQMGTEEPQGRAPWGSCSHLAPGSVQQEIPALPSACGATRLLIVFRGTLQSCLIFLPSLLHKFSWPGKFLRGQ